LAITGSVHEDDCCVWRHISIIRSALLYVKTSDCYNKDTYSRTNKIAEATINDIYFFYINCLCNFVFVWRWRDKL